MIRDWFRTTNSLRSQLAEAEELLEEAREEAVELAAERDRLREALIECRAASRGEVLVERARADALEARLATLQEANMAADRGW